MKKQELPEQELPKQELAKTATEKNGPRPNLLENIGGLPTKESIKKMADGLSLRTIFLYKHFSKALDALDDTAESYEFSGDTERAEVHDKQAEHFRMSRLLYRVIQNPEKFARLVDEKGKELREKEKPAKRKHRYLAEVSWKWQREQRQIISIC